MSGGEPFLRPDLIDLIRHISTTKMRLDIATNGFHLPENRLRALRDLPVFQIQVSIDGIGRQHDQFRGKDGAFAAATRTIERLRDEGIVVSLSTTVTSQNVENFERIIDFALKMECSGFKAIPFLPAGRGRKNARSLMIDAEGYLRLCRILVKRSEELKGTLNISTETTFPFLLEKAPGNAPENGHMACSAGYDTLSIGADGTVYPCPFLRDFPLGNLLECSLYPLWKQDPILNTLRTIEKKDMWEPCKSCGYCQTTCRGGCRAAAYLVHGDFRACDPTCFKSIIQHNI
jgi:radical SAM protein with 4Fe4S-binding SPASM domain